MINPYIENRKRRDRHQIISDILRIARFGELKTRIMYNANLSFAQTNEYLSFLLETGLLGTVEHHNPKDKTLYKTTYKGLDYLNAYKELINCFKNES